LTPTRRDFLTTATGTVVGAAAGAALTHVASAHAHHAHDHDHDGDSGPVPSEFVLRVKALESLLVEKGLVDASALDHFVDRFQTKIGPRQGARVVARAWVDPGYKARLLEDAAAAATEFGYEKGDEHLCAVENTQAVHNLVVCTLCSCYPTNLLGIQPPWYTSYAYRSRAVVDPRGLLREFGLTLPADVDVRVWDSTAEVRYLVVPERPAGTEGMNEERLADLVTRDALIGVARVEAIDRPTR
jgi:nitrile hydratase